MEDSKKPSRRDFVRMCDEQKSWEEIAATFKVGGKMVRKLARQLGIEKKATWDKNIDPKKLRELITSGAEWTDVAAHFGVCVACVHTHAKKLGIKKPKKRDIILPLEAFKESLTWGWSWTKIAAFFEVSDNTVIRQAKRLGLTKAPIVYRSGTVYTSERFKDWFDDDSDIDDSEGIE